MIVSELYLDSTLLSNFSRSLNKITEKLFIHRLSSIINSVSINPPQKLMYVCIIKTLKT